MRHKSWKSQIYLPLKVRQIYMENLVIIYRKITKIRIQQVCWIPHQYGVAQGPIRRERWTVSAQRILRAGNYSIWYCDGYMSLHICLNPNHTKRRALSNDVSMWVHQFSYYSGGDVDDAGGYACVEGRGMSQNLLINFAMGANSQVESEKSVLFHI